jgi:hypothetical protein
MGQVGEAAEPILQSRYQPPGSAVERECRARHRGEDELVNHAEHPAKR